MGLFDLTPTGAVVMGVFAVVLIFAGLVLLVLMTDATIPFGIMLIVFGCVIPAIGLAMRVGRMRQKKLAAIAEQMGFAFIPALTVASLRAVAPFMLYARGYAQRAANAMQGRVGACDVLTFEYQYTIGGGESTHTVSHSVVLLFDGADGVPDFVLTPRTFIDKLVGMFGQGGVEVENAGEFGKRCKLTGHDEAALRQTFQPELTQYLAQDGKWHIQALNGQLLLYRSPKGRPERVPGLVTDALEIRDLLRGVRRPAL